MPRPAAEIVVSLRLAGQSAALHIADNGADRPGGLNSDATDIGRNAAAALARQIGGTLASDDAGAAHTFGNARVGTLWRLDFPLRHETRRDAVTRQDRAPHLRMAHAGL